MERVAGPTVCSARAATALPKIYSARLWALIWASPELATVADRRAAKSPVPTRSRLLAVLFWTDRILSMELRAATEGTAGAGAVSPGPGRTL